MAHYDKYEPLAGGFRAKLAAAWAAADGVPIGVGLNNTGKIVVGAGATGIVGIVILSKFNKKAGEVADVMTDGEIVEATGLNAGSRVYADDVTGVLSNTYGVGKTQVGWTVEADRIIVRTGGEVGS